MAIEGDVNAASTTNVRPNGGKKARKGKKHQKGHEETLLDPTPSEALTSHPPSTTEVSDDEHGEEAIDITAGEDIRELSSTSASIEPSSSTSMLDGTSNVLMKPQRNHNKGPIFHGKEVRDCLPKGFRHASAPSRYVNYHILGSIGCSQGKNIKKLP
ncbi:hypothetical protein H5410_058344 [Solanum commersonii]|uniref:Uncharacterized protein n=1 Tax=Solanum commersonii TaxID=4109 RepID=A0A9J5WRD6_SOLCO|nr:hypothetical protein H5410_058344 [Solanum commersonii]